VPDRDARGVCDDCGQPFVLSAGELRHRGLRLDRSPRRCSRCLIAAAHERSAGLASSANRAGAGPGG
jgi:hypothetical protein